MKSLRFNNLEVRLAHTEFDIDAAQALRYRAFFEDMGASPTTECENLSRDKDQFDARSDHLLVVDLDRSKPQRPCVVGTYRLLSGRQTQTFYSESEFDLRALKSYPGEILELSRSCVDKRYRKRGVMQLLWRGLADYIIGHSIRLLFGCGSIHGTDVERVEPMLSYLHHFHTAPSHLRPVALHHRYVPMNSLSQHAINPQQMQSQLPPLLKAYLRVGGYIGDGAVIDHQFNTIDVCVVVETQKIAAKYARHFIKERDSTRAADRELVLV